MATCGVSIDEFPTKSLLPKAETQVENFLTKYPNFNGENVLIAIFDSGVDPGAAGLQKTTNGERKIADLIDCSGSGDVDTSTIVTATDDGIVEGKTGRKLRIPSSWTNPSGKYHIGIKDASSLLPRSLAKRMQKERKERDWTPSHNLCLTEASKNLVEFEAKHPNPSTEEEKLNHENLKQLVESLKTINQKYTDNGPVYDCVVFHDGDMWRACVDTSETGDLDSCELLGPYKLTGKYARLSREDMMNFSINVYENGNKLSIVTTCSSHGTHVASIAASYFEDQPEMNGVAPGAQIISMSIGDGRVDTMETGTAIIRAIKCAIDNKVDVINMSYGEGAKWANLGRIMEKINYMVAEHNIIFVSSAGNNGPALTTVGCPGAMTTNVIGVGAYVSPDMMTAEYSMLEKMTATQYTWSSRGPCVDGSLGVCITAPGGAITSVPNWTLSKRQLMNGTSMSSPNSVGCIAVILSGLKKESIVYSPFSIRRALENTALKVTGMLPFCQGQGLIQVDKCYEFLKEVNSIDKFGNEISFKVICGKNKHGIYIRNSGEHQHPPKYVVTVKPVFPKTTDNDLKITFDLNCSLVVAESWVKCPKFVGISNGARSFPVMVETKDLQPRCHFTEILGYDPQQVQFGPLFRIPITVIIPEKVDNYRNAINMNLPVFKPQGIHRKFYMVPEGATWATLNLLPYGNYEHDVRYVIHALQIENEAAYLENEFQKYVTLTAKQSVPNEYIFRVKGGLMLEVTIARWWQVTGDTHVEANLQFHSLAPDNRDVTLATSSVFTTVRVKNTLCEEEIMPIAELTYHVIPIKPKEKLLAPLSERDLLPDNQQIYSLILTYKFSLSKASDVIVYFNLLSDLLYESKYESQLCLIYDKNKCLCGVSDAFPIKYQYISKLEKGDYTMKFQIRHDNVETLESLSDLPAELFITLPKVQLDVYSSRLNLMDKNNKFKMRSLSSQDECLVYLTAPSEDKYPADMKVGEKLVGKISYSHKTSVNTKISYPFTVIVTSPVKSCLENKNKDKKETKKVEDEYREAYEDFVVSWVPKITDNEFLENVTKEMEKDDLKLLDATLNALDGLKNRNEKLGDIISVGKKIVDKIDEQSLLAHLGMKLDSSPEAVQIKRKNEKLKKYYLNGNHKMGIAAADLCIESQDPKYLSDVDMAYKNMLKVVDTNDPDMLMLTIRHGMAYKQYGRSLKALLKYFEDHGHTKPYFETFIQLANSCGWTHVVNTLRRTILMKFPSDYQPF